MQNKKACLHDQYPNWLGLALIYMCLPRPPSARTITPPFLGNIIKRRDYSHPNSVRDVKRHIFKAKLAVWNECFVLVALKEGKDGLVVWKLRDENHARR